MHVLRCTYEGGSDFPSSFANTCRNPSDEVITRSSVPDSVVMGRTKEADQCRGCDDPSQVWHKMETTGTAQKERLSIQKCLVKFTV